MKTFSVIATLAMALVVNAQTGHFKPYRVSNDFREVSNLKPFMSVVALTPEHKELLRKNLFVVSPRGDDQLYWVYGRNDYRNLPSLVTTDTVLHLYHVFFDGTLRRLEEDALLPRLQTLSKKMVAASQRQMDALKDPAMKEAARKNLAYFSVAQALTEGSAFPADNSLEATDELRMVADSKGFTKSAIFPYKVDYSRFIPRGHYTKSEKLKRFFRAMTWYGLMPFSMTNNRQPAGEQIRMAVLAADALKSGGATADWEAIYEPTELYVGASNTLTPQEVREAAIDVFASTQKLPSAKFAKFVSKLRELRQPKIQANIKEMAGVPDTDVQFRFMGLRYIPDSEMMQRLTNNYRPMATGLDIMAVLGSARAADIVDSNPGKFNPLNWKGYLAERGKLQSEFSQLPSGTWSSNLYWSWFDAIRLLLKPAPQGYPEFMRSAAWQDKNLNTALASWTELRHDTILYGEQSVAEMGGGDEEVPFVKGFVEPNVAVYDRLIALCKQSRVELQKRKLIGATAVEKFSDFEELLSFLASVSRKELAGTKLTRKEHERIRYIEGELGDLTESMLKYAGNYQALTEDDLNMALIADVHTGGMRALEEAVGKADDLIAIVPIEGKLYMARGSAFSYYEFTVPISERLTDEAWKKMLEEGKAPPRPFWTKSYFTTKTAAERQ